MTLILSLVAVLSFFAAYGLCYYFFRLKISNQTQKMLKVMRADELNLDRPNDAYENSDNSFSDLERAAFSLRRKYLRLKKNSQDERQAYETVFSGLKEAIVTVDSQLKIISFNSAFIELFKWNPEGYQQNVYLHDIVREPELIESFKKVFSEKKIIKNEMSHFHLFVSLLPSVEENQNWALGVFYDLSEMQKIEKIRVDFVANASHELRTPLTVIKGYSDLLHSKIQKEDPKLNELVLPIVESAQTMTLLLDDLLNLSKLENQDRLEKEKINTQQVTESVLAELDSVIVMNRKHILCRYDTTEVFADYISLQQILRNLIVNAIRYSGPEAQTIQVSWLQQNGHVVLKVKDEGAGIPLVHVDRIFERFYRIDKGRSRNKGGSGIGLALVKHHMLNHGGQVYVTSKLGQGSEFVCEFP